MPLWASLLLLLLPLMLIAGNYWRSGRQGFMKYGLIWLIIIAVIAIGYDALNPRTATEADPTKALPEMGNPKEGSEI
jgi:hypothetical protein